MSPARTCGSQAASRWCRRRSTDPRIASSGVAQTCYRHPDRETNVSCSRCARPICPDCMTPSPVGMRCPECAGDRTSTAAVRFGRRETPYATYALLALNVIAFIAEIGGGGGAATLGGGGSLIDGGGL